MQNIITDDLIAKYLEEIKKIDVVQNLQSMTWPFCLSTELWRTCINDSFIVDLNYMKKIKYFGNNSNMLSSEVNDLPDDSGGVYIYSIENGIVPSLGSYIMYVGRARKTKSENLRARAKSHYSQYKRHEENERLERLFDSWDQYVYFSYLPINGNNLIDLVEEQLITALTPPCNKEYPAPKVRRKLNASFFI
ncbi:MAG: hypothetical protein NC331_01005 [Lachnospiraceae bacterium]|nr:hypothetical protein [Lachnospiraceae bacterium]MCM1237947.1 hypothetical protein [Lachnospiraceae bacterium]